VQSVIRLLKGKNTPAAQREWSSLVESFKDSSIPIDINDLIQYVLRQSYMESNRDLQFYAAKVRHMNEQKQAMRYYLQSLREMQDGISSRAVLEDLKTAIDAAEEKLNSIGDDAQLANIDLQNMLQKQQQTIQMLSNVSKVLHDTAMAVIRKIG
jgi:predicted  nucleic acid-binding Zn-ribbon protein